jgi:hypothetical protein
MPDSTEKPVKWAKIIAILISRQFSAHFLMVCFIVLPSIGVSMVHTPGTGLIVAGATAGFYGFILGRD